MCSELGIMNLHCIRSERRKGYEDSEEARVHNEPKDRPKIETNVVALRVTDSSG